MNVLDLFSGIGGFSLAAHAVGFDTLAFCEIEPYAASVLRRHWPDGGSLNPSWVETLMGYPIGYTLPDGDPMCDLPGVWPVGHAEDGKWPTPRAGNPGSRTPGTGGKVIAEEARKAQTWPAGLGAPQHEWEPPRLTSVKENRANRLKALGNSIVPQVALRWMEAIAADMQNAPATCEGVQACDDVQLREQVAR